VIGFAFSRRIYMSIFRRSDEKLLTLTDLFLPEQRAVPLIQKRFEYEKPYVIDAIVRAYNFADPIPIKLYEFMDYFDTDDKKLKITYDLWMNWLSEIQNQYPQLPRMQVEIPYFQDDKYIKTQPRYKPYIWKCINFS
jgi:hypothetical protein